MSGPKLSILMAVYNGSKHVQNAILSILAQSYSDFEFIIINDGSTDDTLEKIKAFHDSRIVLINQKNQGLTKSLNNALSIAKGEFIARQDADDISIFDRLERQFNRFDKEPELDMIGTSMFISNPKGIYNEIFHYPQTDSECKTALLKYNPFIHGSVMLRKRALDNIGGYNESFRYVQDYELWGRLVPLIKCCNLSEPLYARLRDKDCSETTIDKTEYVNKIQEKISYFK